MKRLVSQFYCSLELVCHIALLVLEISQLNDENLLYFDILNLNDK